MSVETHAKTRTVIADDVRSGRAAFHATTPASRARAQLGPAFGEFTIRHIPQDAVNLWGFKTAEARDLFVEQYGAKAVVA